MSFTINGQPYGKFQLIEYGLDADGSVNTASYTSHWIVLAPNASTVDIVRSLKRAGYLKRGLHFDKFDVHGDEGGILYVTHSTHGPVCELRRDIPDCTRCGVERYFEHDLHGDGACEACESELADGES